MVKYEKLEVNYGTTINTGDYESKRIDMKAIIQLEEGDIFETASELAKKDLEQKIDTWEQKLRAKIPPKTFQQTHETNAELPVIVDDTLTPLQNGTYICPVCGEQMFPKEGKAYYLCSKHWGYPDMIKSGQVKVKKF